MNSKTFYLNGIVIKTSPLGEYDRLVSLYTEEKGLVRLAARVSRKSGARNTGGLEPMTLVRVLARKGRTIDSIVQVEVIRSRDVLACNYDVLMTAYAMLELVMLVGIEGQPSPVLFRALDNSLQALLSDSLTPEKLRVILLRFKLSVLKLEGLAINFEFCRRCGGKTGNDAVYLRDTAAVVCKKCLEDGEAFFPAGPASEFYKAMKNQTSSAVGYEEMKALENIVNFHLKWHLDYRSRVEELMEASR